MALWYRDLPVVTVPRGVTPKVVTLIVPYYENQAFFAVQQAHWRAYPDDLRGYLRVIVVDDGSPQPATLAAPPLPFLRLFRIEQDVRWNWLAARNIGAHHAEDGWLLLTDMDHVVPADTLRAVVYGHHDPARVYAFARREHTGVAIHSHSASFLMTRGMFWRIGGYDEALSGHYGTDGEYRRRLAATAQLQILTEPLERHEYIADASTTRYQRKQPIDAAVKHLVAARRPGWRPRVLSFPYHEVAHVA